MEEARSLGYDLVEYYLLHIAPQIQPHLIEERFEFHLPGVEWPIVGYVDLIDRQGNVIDHKTASSPFPEDYLEHDIQLLAYSLGYGILRLGSKARPGQLPLAQFLPPVRVDVLIKAEPVTHQSLELRYTQPHIEEFVGRVNAVVNGVRQEQFAPFWQVRGEEPDVCRRCEYRYVCQHSLAPQPDEEEELIEEGEDLEQN